MKFLRIAKSPDGLASGTGLPYDGFMEDARNLPDYNTPNAANVPDNSPPPPPKPREIGGPKGPEPTRYGDWEVGGRCTDF